jgi:drug/metabolite transporter (DMT)-like permease
LTRGIVAALVAAALFGVGGTLAQFLFTQRGVDVGWLVSLRLLTSGILLLATCAVRGRRLFTIWRDSAASLLLFAIIGMLGVQYTFMAAIAASNTATATVIQYTAPAMVALWLMLATRHLPGMRQAVAIALAVAGTFLLATHGDVARLHISPAALAWGIAAAVTAAFNALQPVPLLKRHGASVVTGWGMLIGGIALSFYHPPWPVTGQWDAKAITFLLFILLFGSLLAFYLSLKAVALIGAQKSSLLNCAEPLSAALLSVWWLKVDWGWVDWLGAALIMVTVILLTREQSAESQAEHVT